MGKSLGVEAANENSLAIIAGQEELTERVQRIDDELFQGFQQKQEEIRVEGIRADIAALLEAEKTE